MTPAVPQSTFTTRQQDALDLAFQPLVGGIASQGRLTLTTGLPVTVADVTAAGTVYFTPTTGKWTEVSLALDSNAAHTGYHQSGKLFDFFLENSTGSWRLVTGPAWTSTTARSAAISKTNGYYVNTASMTAKFDTSASTVTVGALQGVYVGSAYMSAGAQTNDSAALRHLWNMYNRSPRKLLRQDTTDSWTYSTASFQQANNTNVNQVEMIRGLDEDTVYLQVMGLTTNSTVTVRTVAVAVGLDSTTAKAADCNAQQSDCTTSKRGQPHAIYSGFPGLGYHFLAWLERGDGTDTQTWYGDAGTAFLQDGMTGMCFA